jgi:DNA-binding MarR family transcriptional regulator
MRTERSADALSTNKLAVLSHLYRNGPATPGRIAAVERQRPQSLTRVFAELEQAGLIMRASSPQDRRQSVLELTATGLRALADDMAQRDAWLAAALGGLSETERQVLVIAAGIMDRLAEAEVTVLPDLETRAEPESHSAPESPSKPESPSELQQDASAREDDSGLH